MAHVLLACSYLACPKGDAFAEDGHTSWHVLKFDISNSELRTDRTVSQLRRGQIQVVLLFHPVIRKLIANCEPDAQRFTGRADYINARDFRLFSAIPSIGRHDQLLAMCPKYQAIPLEKPFRLNPDLPGLRRPAFEADFIHAKAVRHLRGRLVVHSSAMFRTFLVC